MPRVHAGALMGLVDSDDEGDVLGAGAAQRRGGASSGMAPAKRGRPAGTGRGGKTVGAAPRSASVATGGARKPLHDKPHNATALEDGARGKKRAATAELDHKAKVAKGRTTRPTKTQKLAQNVAHDDDEEGDYGDEEAQEEYEEVQARPAAPRARKGRPPARARAATPPADDEIPENQYSPADIEEEEEKFDHMEYSIEDVEEEEEVVQPDPIPRVRAASVQRTKPRVPSSATKRSTPGPESRTAGNDPIMRRRLGDLTLKYEALEAKYMTLRELGIKEAERNYDLLKKQSEERAKSANELIATLKAQLAAKAEVVKESQVLRQQLDERAGVVERLQAEVDSLQGSLADSRKEAKTLTTKLSAARVADTAAVKIPGSAMKGSTADKRVIANAEAMVQAAQMKEDLYGDLTGLIIRGVKREEDEDVYDCIQTGRNGTLHFKLATGVDGANDNYDETQFVYMPQLDDDRDQDLKELLPDYLSEDITFPRPQAARFYSRVMKALTERLD
ncbi:chromosome segregation protein Csm1/Pcs1-domain-containing protein [Microdochium trichocladiopsis]|uniref:Chromosome segregation protein Csm1/Pcs1-domain-containing protein n=1 Tax=Microdochium trichocladiopsis TaxID=1682393 RepID=A0A9P9BU00_9PEZI|nr:chromosome segregation protein Csm1/Pcs1-domain-containing protein [Microdochium trichocladiopsis]KAH7030964.1 chromosome segregation protein Csm1/Pcs1-domain-containing protein [Microdochium trichocladiopsis]